MVINYPLETSVKKYMAGRFGSISGSKGRFCTYCDLLIQNERFA
jgi:hypothetical protein